MSVWVSEEVMRCCLRFCSRRSLWQRRSFLATVSIRETPFPSQQSSAHTWVKGQSRTCLENSFSSVRFYSRIHSEDLMEKQLPSSTLDDPAELQPDETTSTQAQRDLRFMDLLRRCDSQSDALDLISQFTPTNTQISDCLSRMWSITKGMSVEQRRYELQLMFEHPAFDLLLNTAMKRAPYFRNNDLVYSLLGMVRLGVPQKSRVVQTFLRNCQYSLNDLDERCLSILALCLELMEDGANVSALKEGVRLVVEARLPEIKNMTALLPMMCLVKKDAPRKLKMKLEVKALSMEDQFNLSNTLNMIPTLATMGFRSKPLLELCSKIIKENLNDVSFTRLHTVLQSHKELHYRDVDLLTSISEYIASTMDLWKKKQLLLLLSVFEGLNFCPNALMEAFAQKVISDPDALAHKDLLCVLKVYSTFNYDLQHQRQQFLDSLIQALGPYQSKMSGLRLLKVVYYLCLLGHFPSAVLEQLFHSSTLETLHCTAPQVLPYQEKLFRTVNLCLRLDRPPLPSPLAVPPTLLGNPDLSIEPPVDLLCSQSLQSLLEDHSDAILQEKVVVEDFYLIEAVITKPNQTSATEASSRSPSPAEGSQRIAVIYAQPSAFCYGTSHPCGPLATKIRHLKILGYEPVLVTAQELHCEEKRADVLRRRIFPEHHRSDAGAEAEPGS